MTSQAAARVPDRSPLAFFADHEPDTATFLEDALDGFGARRKRLSPKYFYDEKGSQIFDRICETEEYYVTRTELDLLDRLGPEFASRAGTDAMVIEFGSGSSIKIRRLLDALEEPAGYVAIDISRDHLIAAAEAIATDYPEIAVGAICADFTKPVPLPDEVEAHRGVKLGFLPGSTIGNFAPPDAAGFLETARAMLGPGNALLIGVDLKKEKARLDAAYNDASGHTAAFNLNLLDRMSRELDADLDREAFSHKAFYNEQKGRVEMHLESLKPQDVTIAGEAFSLDGGETIHTENSYKYTVEEFASLAGSAGFGHGAVWTDRENLFSIHWLSVPA